MGSGAFLVQACRWLADRLVESWSQVEALGKAVSVDGEVLDAGATKEPLPRDSEARTVIARRLIAERCLYGVDLNPLAVELAKLSIWLVTLAKGRPFGFLDHNLRCGNSLLGIHRLDQLTQLSTNPTDQGQLRLFGQNIKRAVGEAIRTAEAVTRDAHPRYPGCGGHGTSGCGCSPQARSAGMHRRCIPWEGVRIGRQWRRA
ncbi:hypothetical protein P4114_21245 [Pseudomonas aeruginosa]|nr:hypothetical protein [Pseudomonas aeruginosa]